MEGNNFHSRSQYGEEIEPLESRVTAFSIGGEFGNRNSNSQPGLGELEIASKHNDLQAMVGFKSQQVAKHEECDTELPQCTVEESDGKRGFVSQQLAKPEECDTELPECTKEENDEKGGCVSQQIAIHEECYSGLPQCMNKKNDEKGGFVSQQMAKPEECDAKLHQHTRQENDKKSVTIGRQMVNTKECDTELPKQTSEKNDEKSGFIGQQRAKLEECDIELPKQTKEENNYKKELNVSYQKGGKYFFYDSPLPEETGVWIPVSVPPMSESEHAEWNRGFCSNGGYFPEGDLGWSQYDGEDKELTMWDVVVEMVLVARGKVSALASGDIHKISWISSHLIEQAWKEMAQTLTEANVGDTREILEAKPPKWLPDSAASACMLCSVRFHPIMCTRHHCRFCGGVFCSECTKGRSLLPEKFRVGDPQRVCDVCCVRLESVQPYLMEQVSRAAQFPTHDLTDLSTLRSWVNFPWGQSMEYEIYKATNTIRGYNTVGSLRPEKSIPEAILRQAKGLAILTVMKVGVMVTYNIGTGLVIACREDGSWSPPSAISSFGVRWGAQAGGELTDFIIVLRTNDAVKTFSGDAHLSFGAGLSAAAGIVGRTVEADLRAGDGGYAACYTYSCSKGAFVGCSLGGSIITTRKLENSRFYGSQFINASDILLGSLPRPPAAGILYRALADLYQKFRG